MKKTYILDTNVLIYDPRAIFRFEDNEVVIPIFVLEELDKFKRESSDRGRNAREVARILDPLNLRDGANLPNGGVVRVWLPESIPTHDTMDQAILFTALEIARGRNPVILITMDTNLRVRGQCYGLQTETYEALQVEETSVTTVAVEVDNLDDFFQYRKLDVGPYPENTSLLLKDGTDTALARYVDGFARPLNLPPTGVQGIRPKNREQSYALDLLLDPSVHLVTLSGMAGTGKTLLALAAGVQHVSEGRFEQILVTRPTVPMGRDLGYLPGSLEEKLQPWMMPIFDNLSLILGKKEADFIQMEPLSMIRGRSLTQRFLIADECFPYDTEILLADGVPLSIGKLFDLYVQGKELPPVTSYNVMEGKATTGRVVEMWHRGVRTTLEVRSVEGQRIRCTEDHPFLTSRGWVGAFDLDKGDTIITHNGKIQIDRIKGTGHKEHVFDMEVEDHHTFAVGVEGWIVHNCQNLSLHEAKTLISRCGKGTKIVLTGDPHQIDNPYVDSTTNGLSQVAARFRGERLCGAVTLLRGERSPLAELATRLL